MKIYLAGPMTGIPQLNFPFFRYVATKLREWGHEVANPAEHDMSTTPAIVHEVGYRTGDVSQTRSFDSRAAFCWDFAQILDAHAIVLLPGWEKSNGARMERLVAEKTGKLICLWTNENHPNGPGFEADLIQVRMLAIIGVTSDA